MGRKVETAVRRRVRVSVKCDIGNGITPGGQPCATAQPLLYYCERMLAARVVLGDTIGQPRLLCQWQVQFPMAVYRDIRLVAILFEEHPTQHVRLIPGFAGKQRSVAGKEIKD